MLFRFVRARWFEIQTEVAYCRANAAFQNPDTDLVRCHRLCAADAFVADSPAFGNLLPLPVNKSINSKFDYPLAEVVNLLLEHDTVECLVAV